jgi:hypothetical protein
LHAFVPGWSWLAVETLQHCSKRWLLIAILISIHTL